MAGKKNFFKWNQETLKLHAKEAKEWTDNENAKMILTLSQRYF
jgi:hypothetical protein